MYVCADVFNHLHVLDVSMCQDLVSFTPSMGSLLVFLSMACLFVPVMVVSEDSLQNLSLVLLGSDLPETWHCVHHGMLSQRRR